MKGWTLAAAAALALVAGIGAGWWWHTQQAAPPLPRPAFTLEDADGQLREAREWDGKLVVVNFWATWCTPCLTEMPRLAKFQKAHENNGLQVIGPALDDPEAVRRYLTQRPVPYPVLLGDREVMSLMDAMGDTLGALPFTVVIDRDGMIVDRHWGELDESDLESIAKRWL